MLFKLKKNFPSQVQFLMNLIAQIGIIFLKKGEKLILLDKKIFKYNTALELTIKRLIRIINPSILTLSFLKGRIPYSLLIVEYGERE